MVDLRGGATGDLSERRAPPLAVISFYNQHMQIRNGQSINHSWAADIEWLLLVNMESIRPQTYARLQRFIPGQLFHSFFVQQRN